MIPIGMSDPQIDIVQFDLTDECPLFCSHCSNSSGPRINTAIKFENLSLTVQQAMDLGCREFVLSGGEPLRYAELPEVLRLLKTNHLGSSIFTTGIRDKTSRTPLDVIEWARLRALGLQSATFSVYAAPGNREFHNDIVRLRPTNTWDAFGANEQAIKNAQMAQISVEIQFIPSDETCAELSAIADWAALIGASKLHLQFPTQQGRNATTLALRVTEAHESNLRSYSLALTDRGPLPLHISRLWRSRWNLGESAALSQIIVRSDGVVTRCNACKYKSVSQKNIYRESLLEIWKDDDWRNALCNCSTRGLKEAISSSGREVLHVVQENGLLAPSTN
jgi:MoaA/NifB/PqqE/SkfB family radical SAM enzyme